MINEEVHKAFEVIQQGGIILYPTDTVWGIGCDATNAENVLMVKKNRNLNYLLKKHYFCSTNI